MKAIIKTFLATIILFSLPLLMVFSFGCSKSSTGPETEPIVFDLDGFWVGGFVFKEAGQATGYLNTFAIIAPDGRAFFLTLSFDSPHFRLSAYGSLRKEKTGVTGTLNIYDSTGTPAGTLNITNGKTVETTVEGRKIHSLVAQFSGSADPLKGAGELTVTLVDSVYDLPSSLSSIAGHWDFIEEDGTTFLDIDTNGNFTGGNTGGCQFTGKIEIINAEKNLYNIKSFVISNCGAPWDGKYQGLATITEGDLDWAVVKEDESFGFFIIFSK